MSEANTISYSWVWVSVAHTRYSMYCNIVIEERLHEPKRKSKKKNIIIILIIVFASLTL